MRESASLTISKIDNIYYLEPNHAEGFICSTTRPFKNVGPRACHGIILKLHGDSRYCFSDSKQINVSAGNIVYLPQGSSYTVYSDENGGLFYANFYSLESNVRTPVLIKPHSLAKWENQFVALQDCWLKRKAGYLLQCYSILYDMLAEIERCQNAEYLPSDKAAVIIRSVEQLEKADGISSISVTELAEKCHMSETYYRRLFHNIYGVSPKQFVIDSKIRKAKALLELSSLPVSIVAEKAGFSNLVHFSRLFKEKTGFTSSEYRDRNF